MASDTISAITESHLIKGYRRGGSPASAKMAGGVGTQRNTTVKASAPLKVVSDTSRAGSDMATQNMTEAVEQVRQYVRDVVPELDFSIDEDTGKLVVKVMDTATNEVLRQIPSEEMLHVAKMLDTLQGLLFQDRA